MESKLTHWNIDGLLSTIVHFVKSLQEFFKIKLNIYHSENIW